MFIVFCIVVIKVALADETPQINKDTSLQLLSELPLDKLLRLRSSLREFSSVGATNGSLPPPQREGTPDGAQAMALHSQTPIKRGDNEEQDVKKTDYGHGKISSIFSLSVTMLAFLAFGGYLLCLIVQAVKYKSSYDGAATQPTFLVSAGIKKRPQVQSQFASYGRRRRDDGEGAESGPGPTPDELYGALLGLCEGYSRWDGLNLGVL